MWETVVGSKGTTVVTEGLEGEGDFDVGWACESGEVSVRGTSVKNYNEINMYYGVEYKAAQTSQELQRGGTRIIALQCAKGESQDEVKRIGERFFPIVRSSQGG